MHDNLQALLARLKWFYFGSLKGRLIALSLGLSITFLWALVFFSAAVQKHRFIEVLSDQQFASAQRLAADLDYKLRDRIRDLSSAAANVPAGLTPMDLDPYLARLSGLHSTFSAGIAIIRLDGTLIADYPLMPERRNRDFSDRDYFMKVVETGKPYIDKPIIGRTLKRPLLTISVPVFDGDGNLRAVMTGITDLSAPNFLGLILNHAMSGKGELFVISPHDNMIVAATDVRRAMTAPPARGRNLMYDRFADGFEGSGIATSSEGIAKLYSAKYVPAAHWIFMAALPTDIALRPVTVMRNSLAAIAAILTLLAVFLTYWITRRMFAPLDEAVKTMRRMTEGGAPLMRLPVKSRDEIGGLINHFNALVEECYRSEAALADSEQRLRMLFENAPNAIFVQTRGCFAYVNSAALRLFGAGSCEQLLGHPVMERAHPDWRADLADCIRVINETRTHIAPVEKKLLRLDGVAIDAELSAIPYYYEHEHGCLFFAHDITERKRADEALRASEDRFHRLVALSSEWYWEQDEHYRFTRISGWGTEQARERRALLIGRTRWEVTSDMDDATWIAHRAMLDARLAFREFEYKARDLDGSIIWYSLNGEPLFDEHGAFTGYHGTGRIITQRKLAEEALLQTKARIRELAAHQEKIKEAERKRIARDIHDDLGQTLLALRLDVSMLAERTADLHPRLHSKVSAMLSYIDTATKSVRAIINDLRPSVLDLGLLAAMEWQVREFERRSGIACVLEAGSEDFDRCLDENSSASLFRIVQESLTNVLRHAQASRVHVAASMASGRLDITIADNGIGISAESRRKKNSFGLTGIEERIRTLGGTFAIDSAAGQGTLLRFSIPVAMPAQPAAGIKVAERA